jgi:hypothetical protein
VGRIKPDRSEAPKADQCFVLKAAALYRQEYSSKPPEPGTMAWLTAGQLRSARESIHAALRRGAIRLVDAREELGVLQAALELLKGAPTYATAPVRIADEPFRIREPRKSGSKSKRKRKKRKR